MNTNQKKKKEEEAIQFLKEFFLPQNEKEELEVAAHSLAGAFLVKIEAVLEEKKMSKKELAKKIGTSASYLSQIFYSRVLLNFKTLAKIEKALDIDFVVCLKEELHNEEKMNISNFSSTKNKIKTTNQNEIAS